MDENPAPNPMAFHTRGGPDSGQDLSRPISWERPSRFGPRHCGQSLAKPIAETRTTRNTQTKLLRHCIMTSPYSRDLSFDLIIGATAPHFLNNTTIGMVISTRILMRLHYRKQRIWGSDIAPYIASILWRLHRLICLFIEGIIHHMAEEKNFLFVYQFLLVILLGWIVVKIGSQLWPAMNNFFLVRYHDTLQLLSKTLKNGYGKSEEILLSTVAGNSSRL